MRELICVIRLCTVLLWSTTVMAATLAPPFGDSLRGVTAWGWSILLFVSTLSGLTALFNRIVNEKKGLLPRPFLFVSAHMTGSWLAGLLAFFAGLSTEMPDGYMGIAIALASFGGAKGVEKAVERYMAEKGMTVGASTVASTQSQGTSP